VLAQAPIFLEDPAFPPVAALSILTSPAEDCPFERMCAQVAAHFCAVVSVDPLVSRLVLREGAGRKTSALDSPLCSGWMTERPVRVALGKVTRPAPPIVDKLSGSRYLGTTSFITP
jgi:hypothetical protein